MAGDKQSHPEMGREEPVSEVSGGGSEYVDRFRHPLLSDRCPLHCFGSDQAGALVLLIYVEGVCFVPLCQQPPGRGLVTLWLMTRRHPLKLRHLPPFLTGQWIWLPIF